jgi:AcrR family transcriptional regulator
MVARRVPRGQETRERILCEALRLFAARGYVHVSIEEIAEAAGVTKGAVYHWFADKADLGRALLGEVNNRLAHASMPVFEPTGNVVDKMRRTFNAYVDALGSFEEARFFLRDAVMIPELEEAGRRQWDREVEFARDVIAAAIARGEIVALDPDALAHVLMGMWSDATLHVLRTGDRDGTLAVVERFMTALRPVPDPADSPLVPG